MHQQTDTAPAALVLRDLHLWVSPSEAQTSENLLFSFLASFFLESFTCGFNCHRSVDVAEVQSCQAWSLGGPASISWAGTRLTRSHSRSWSCLCPCGAGSYPPADLLNLGLGVAWHLPWLAQGLNLPLSGVPHPLLSRRLSQWEMVSVCGTPSLLGPSLLQVCELWVLLCGVLAGHAAP